MAEAQGSLRAKGNNGSGGSPPASPSAAGPHYYWLLSPDTMGDSAQFLNCDVVPLDLTKVKRRQSYLYGGECSHMLNFILIIFNWFVCYLVRIIKSRDAHNSIMTL